MAQQPISSNGDEQQAMQAIKQYGGYIVAVILLALAGLFGWNYWQNNHARVDTVAADQYANIQQLNDEVSLAGQNPDLGAEALAALDESRNLLNQDIDALVAEHGDTVYAWQALMIKARHQTDADDLEGASQSLEAARQIDLGDAGLAAIATLRHAKVLLALGDNDAALTAAETEMPTAFEASQQELLGDIHLAQNDKDLAIRAYNNAWELLRERQESRAILALKMESLGVTPEPIEPEASVIAMPNASTLAAAAQPATTDAAGTETGTEAADASEETANADASDNADTQAGVQLTEQPVQ